MTLKIEVNVPHENVENGSAAGYLSNALAAIGYGRVRGVAEERVDCVVTAPGDTPTPDAPEPAAEPAKKRGRRSRAEIEADEKAAAATQQAISTGEERVDPSAAEEPSEEDARQDAEDEAAEQAGRPLTHVDLKNVMGDYVKAYGLPAAQEDGLRMVDKLWPGTKKIADIPDTQEDLARGLAAFKAALADNPYKRERVANG